MGSVTVKATLCTVGIQGQEEQKGSGWKRVRTAISVLPQVFPKGHIPVGQKHEPGRLALVLGMLGVAGGTDIKTSSRGTSLSRKIQASVNDNRPLWQDSRATPCSTELSRNLLVSGGEGENHQRRGSVGWRGGIREQTDTGSVGALLAPASSLIFPFYSDDFYHGACEAQAGLKVTGHIFNPKYVRHKNLCLQ